MATTAHDRFAAVRGVRRRVLAVVVGAAALALSGAGCAATVPPPAPPPGGVAGTVTQSPTCPVATAGAPCPPTPVSARVVALDQHGTVVATTQTDDSGAYALTLAAGTFTLRADPGAPLPRCPDRTVTVADATVRADIACDSGIR